MEKIMFLYQTRDIKLQAFLRLKCPKNFIGLDTDREGNIVFCFRSNERLTKYMDGYYEGRDYAINPFLYASKIEEGRELMQSKYPEYF